jgi:hypothetical protein
MKAEGIRIVSGLGLLAGGLAAAFTIATAPVSLPIAVGGAALAGLATVANTCGNLMSREVNSLDVFAKRAFLGTGASTLIGGGLAAAFAIGAAPVALPLAAAGATVTGITGIVGGFSLFEKMGEIETRRKSYRYGSDW